LRRGEGNKTGDREGKEMKQREKRPRGGVEETKRGHRGDKEETERRQREKIVGRQRGEGIER
jgi:hypothetical protein